MLRRVNLKHAGRNITKLDNLSIGYLVKRKLEPELSFNLYGQVPKNKESTVLVISVLELVEAGYLGAKKRIAVLARNRSILLLVDEESHDEMVRA